MNEKDLTKLAAGLAALVAALRTAPDDEQRGLRTGMYKALKEAGLPEDAAAEITHHISQAATVAQEEARDA